MSSTELQPAGVVPDGLRGRVEVSERPALAVNGWLTVLVIFALTAVAVLLGLNMPGWPAAIPVVVIVIAASTLTIVSPGQSRVVLFFGSYVGTLRHPGLHSVLPLTAKRSLSLRVRNFETERLKVNDSDGNPVEIAAIVVWQVTDTAKAAFAVNDFSDFVSMQAESALRHVANGHPYEDTAGLGNSLRGSTDIVSAQLAAEMAIRVALAGIEILEVRITHLAYASEIAQAMLRRQQANAVVAARSRIVEGAVGMVQMALARLTEAGVVELDEERTAAMVSNLMVVLCGDQPASPIVNTGSLYS
jgi:regulator of protease activity HflC (stomatin/prohibitin superfamily)